MSNKGRLPTLIHPALTINKNNVTLFTCSKGAVDVLNPQRLCFFIWFNVNWMGGISNVK